MAEQKSKKAGPESDEIDVGQLFQFLGRGMQKIFRGILRSFLYLKKRAILLLICIVGGFVVGYGLSLLITKQHKIDAIVKPNWESKNYLYDVIREVQSNLEARDTLFFKKMGVPITNFNGYDLSIEPVNDETEIKDKNQLEYLELLQKFENTGLVADVLRAELLDKSSLNHRITLLYKDYDKGPQLLKAVMSRINSNEYYKELTIVNKENAETRISQNNALLEQIDQILESYSTRMSQSGANPQEGRIVLSTEDEVNVADLLELKSSLIRDSERMKLALLEQREPINIINIGNPQVAEKSLFGKKVVLVPLIFVLLLFLVDFIRYLNRKAGEMQTH